MYFVDSAFIAQKPPMQYSVIAASVPPEMTTSARPMRMASSAMPRASVPEAQAVTTVCTGPLA